MLTTILSLWNTRIFISVKLRENSVQLCEITKISGLLHRVARRKYGVSQRIARKHTILIITEMFLLEIITS